MHLHNSPSCSVANVGVFSLIFSSYTIYRDLFFRTRDGQETLKILGRQMLHNTGRKGIPRLYLHHVVRFCHEE